MVAHLIVVVKESGILHVIAFLPSAILTHVEVSGGVPQPVGITSVESCSLLVISNQMTAGMIQHAVQAHQLR